MKVAIVGTGNIGTDLMVKVLKSSKLKLVCFAGQRPDSPGLAEAKGRGVRCSIDGIEGALKASPCLVFDCTSASGHLANASRLQGTKVSCVNLTPSREGELMVFPALNCPRHPPLFALGYGLVTCGAQASVPLAQAACDAIFGHLEEDPPYIEVISSIASLSAGPATRRNLDEYIDATQKAMRKFTQCKLAKAALVINPADPPVKMQTTIYIGSVNEAMIRKARHNVRNHIGEMMEKVQQYCPGYEWAMTPTLVERSGDSVLMMSVKVTGAGDWLPEYAGNLDIITAAAVKVAEGLA